MYCKKCGGKLESYASNCAFCGAPVEKYDDKMNYVKEEKHSVKEKKMGAWRWIGFFMLPCIPLIGSIVQIVLIFKWAFGSINDSTLKGFARAQLILVVFAILIGVAVGVWMVLMPGVFDELLSQMNV